MRKQQACPNQRKRETLMSEPYSLPTEPEGVAASLLERFSSGKVSMMMALYLSLIHISEPTRPY